MPFKTNKQISASTLPQLNIIIGAYIYTSSVWASEILSIFPTSLQMSLHSTTSGIFPSHHITLIVFNGYIFSRVSRGKFPLLSAKVLDFGIIVSGFESRYVIMFLFGNILEKGTNSLIPPAMG